MTVSKSAQKKDKQQSDCELVSIKHDTLTALSYKSIDKSHYMNKT